MTDEPTGDPGPVPGWCPLCQRFVTFGPIKTRDRARCPRCRGRERERVLSVLVDRLAPVIATAGPLLDVASNAAVREQLRELTDTYVGLDLTPRRAANVLGSLTQLPFGDATFGTIICFHVLEHVPDDVAAIAELARVLRPDGLLLLQVPVSEAHGTDEDPGAPEEERIRRFGQADHVRFYGQDVDDRLRAGGLSPVRLRPQQLLDDDVAELMGSDTREVWLCRRTVPGRPDPRLAVTDLRQRSIPRPAGALWARQRTIRTITRERFERSAARAREALNSRRPRGRSGSHRRS